MELTCIMCPVGCTLKVEKDKNGMYYMNYDKIKNPDLKAKFLWIETRLREFEK